MKPTCKLRTALAATAVTAIFAAASTAAAPLSGTFAVSGSFLPMLDGTTVTGLQGANMLDFNDGTTPSPGTPGPISVTDATGDFATLTPVGTTGTVMDIAFGAASAPGFSTPPITGFEQIGIGPAVTVDLLNIHTILQNDAFLNLQGSTVIRASNFTPTAGSYSFSGRVDGGSARFGFLASNDIPEPSTIALLGTALLGLGALRRKSS